MSDVPIFIPQYATTASPSYVSAITRSPKLASITAHVELYRYQGAFWARVFRESSTAPGMFSCEVYQRDDNLRWQLVRKERKKYPRPEVPSSAHHVSIDGIDFWSRTPFQPWDYQTLIVLLPRA